MLQLPQVRAHKQGLQEISNYADWLIRSKLVLTDRLPVYFAVHWLRWACVWNLQVPLWANAFFYTRHCQQTCSYYASRLAEILPQCENSAHEWNVIGANPQPLEFIGMTTIPIINASDEVVHTDFLVQKRGFTLLGVRAMRKLGITISVHQFYYYYNYYHNIAYS